MPLIERITKLDQVKAWYGDIPIESRYTAGLAGERFLRALKEGQIMGVKCPQCEAIYLPPR
ncbi:MAG: zinc ribbon domain-containing protein, partial [Anaerolineae bacterium]